MGDAVTTALLARAERAVEVSNEDPVEADRLAGEVLAEARAAGDDEAISTALRVQGLARRERGDVAAARGFLEEAAAASDRRAGGLARGSLASVLAAGGEMEAALAQLERARAVLSEAGDRAPVEMQRATVLARLGRTDDARAAFGDALAVATEAGDIRTEAMVRINRGIIEGYAGRFADAEDDLSRAEELLRAHGGMDLLAADSRHNRGFVVGRRGDVVRALGLFADARAEHERLGVSRPNAWLDECEVLLAVRLTPEARELAAAAEAALVHAGQLADAAEAQLLLARARARRTATSKPRTPPRPGRSRASPPSNGRRGGCSPSSCACGSPSVVARRRGQRRSRPRGPPRGCRMDRRSRRRVVDRRRDRPRRRRPRASRAAGPRPRVGRGAGDRLVRRGATPSSRWRHAGRHGRRPTGHRAADAAAALLAPRELRTAAVGRGRAVATLGLELAMEARRPATVLSWAEAVRASTLALPRVRPPRDDTLGADLAELRHVSRQVEDARLSGDEDDLADAVDAQRRVERRVLRRTRHLARAEDAPSTSTAGASSPSMAALRERLEGRTLLELAEVGRRLVGVEVGPSRTRLLDLGPVDAVHALVDGLRFAASRATTGQGSFAEAGAAAVAARARELGDVLFGGRRRVDGRGLVLVPTGPLQRVPWAMVPHLEGCPLAVAPSARAWLAPPTGGPAACASARS